MKSVFKWFCLLLMILLVSSCTQYHIIPFPWNPGQDDSESDLIDSAYELQLALRMASDGDVIKFSNLELNIDREEHLLPFDVDKSITLTGNILLSNSSRSLSSDMVSRVANGDIVLFNIADGVNATVEDVQVNIPSGDIAERVRAIVSVNGTASVNVSSVVVDIPAGADPVYAIELGDTATVDSIEISGTAPVSVTISENNQEAVFIANKISESSPESSIDVPDVYTVNDRDSFMTQMHTMGQAVLGSDFTIDTINFQDGDDYSILLNGNTLTVTSYNGINVENGSTLIVSGEGTMNFSFVGLDEVEQDPIVADTYTAIDVFSGGHLILNNVHFIASESGLFATNDNSSISVNNCELDISGAYGISTNASLPAPTGINIDVVGSTITLSNSQTDSTGKMEYSGVGILFNIDGVLTVSDTDIEAGWQGIIARGGTVEITNGSSITSTGGVDSNSVPFVLLRDGANWGQGNQVAYAALVVGNAQVGAGYNYDTMVTISDDSEILLTNEYGWADEEARIFIASANGYEARLICNNQTYTDEIIDNNWFFGEECYLGEGSTPIATN